MSVVKLTYYGHACFLIEGGGARLLTDPFLSGYERSPNGPDEVEADLILVSHGHGDHIGDTVAIAKRTGATTISRVPFLGWLEAQGFENCHPMHIGGAHDLPFGQVKLAPVHHGSMLPDGSSGGGRLLAHHRQQQDLSRVRYGAVPRDEAG